MSEHWKPDATRLDPARLASQVEQMLGDPPVEHAFSGGETGLEGHDAEGALRRILSLTDLTTLEATDTPARVEALCRTALQPAPGVEDAPCVAAVCVYPTLVRVAADALRGTGVGAASVAGAFPSGMSPLRLRVEEVRYAIDEGATEIDAVLPRGVFLSGQWSRTHDEIAAVKQACGEVPLKLILETGELPDPASIYSASMIALDAGSDFIKTSTGKIQPAATPVAFLAMLLALRDHAERTGRQAGIKAAGGIRTPQQALVYLRLAGRVLDIGGRWPAWSPSWFRFGASSLVSNVASLLAADGQTVDVEGGY